MNEKISPSNLKDYSEKTWFLGTDVCEDVDLDLMIEGTGAAFTREEGAIYHVGILNSMGSESHYENLGYSKYFQELMNEANRRGYAWVFFDRDLETST